MHQPFRRLFPLILFAVLVNGCTVEKRLYNKGWSVSPNRGWKQQKSSTAQHHTHSEEDVRVQMPEIQPYMKGPVAVSTVEREEAVPVAVDSAANETDLSVIAAADNEEVTDTLFVDEKDLKKANKPWTKQHKRNSVATVSVLLGLTGLSIVAFLLIINAPGTAILETVFLILLTGVFGILFFILLVLLLAFLFRRPVDKSVKVAAEMTPKEKRNQDIKNRILVSVVIAAGIFVLYKLFGGKYTANASKFQEKQKGQKFLSLSNCVC